MTSEHKRILAQGYFANELRERELTYITLIRDLYQENKYLRGALDREKNKENNSMDYNSKKHLEIPPRVEQANRRYEVLQNQNFQPSQGNRGGQNHILWNISQSMNSQVPNTYLQPKEGFKNTYPWDQIQKRMADEETGGFTFMGGLNNNQEANIQKAVKQTRPIIILGDKEKENISVNILRGKYGFSKTKTIGNSRSVIHLGGSTERFMNQNNNTSRRHSPRYIDMSPTYGQDNTNKSNQNFRLNQNSQQELYSAGLVFCKPNSSNVHQSKESNTIINYLNSPEAAKQAVFYPTGSIVASLASAVKRTVSPPLVFNRNVIPIFQREARHVVHPKLTPFPNMPEIGKNAESREYIVHSSYRESDFNNYEPNHHPNEKIIRQQLVQNDQLKPLANVPTQNIGNFKEKDNKNKNSLNQDCDDIESNTEKAIQDVFLRFAVFQNQKKQTMRPYGTLEKEESKETRNENQEITVRVHQVGQGVKVSKLSQVAQLKEMTSLQNFSKSTISGKKKKNNINISNRIYL